MCSYAEIVVGSGYLWRPSWHVARFSGAWIRYPFSSFWSLNPRRFNCSWRWWWFFTSLLFYICFYSCLWVLVWGWLVGMLWIFACLEFFNIVLQLISWHIYSHIFVTFLSYSNIHNIASYIKGQDPSFSHCVELYRRKIILILQYETSLKIK